MRLLFVTCAVPYPPLTGNGLIGLHHIRYLAAHHTVDLISFKRRKNPNELADLTRWCNNIELVDQSPRWRVLINMLIGLTRDEPLGVFRYKSSKMTRVVNWRLTNAAYDVVLYQGLQTSQYLPNWYHGTTGSVLEDPPALTSQRLLPLCPWYARPLAWNRIGRQKRYEGRYAGRFDRVILVNEDDAINYKNIHNEASLDWVPVGIDTNAFSLSHEIRRRDGMIVISGNMQRRPNVEGVRYFCKKVFPLICERVPSATLWLVGANPARSIREFSRDSRIRVTGFVPDVRDYLQQAMVSVCPIQLRIGTQTKILEALACGTPVVTSRAGNHGIRGVSGEHLFVADEPAEFASRVVSLLRGERWSEFSLNGRRLVEDNFTWEKSGAKLEQILEQLVATTRRDLIRQ
jgi:glycosyltransferase involved in cell wall biosynthesis